MDNNKDKQQFPESERGCEGRPTCASGCYVTPSCMHETSLSGEFYPQRTLLAWSLGTLPHSYACGEHA